MSLLLFFSLKMIIHRFIIAALAGLLADAAPQEQLARIFLRLYTGTVQGIYVDAFVNRAVDLVQYMDAEKNTVIYIHGFTESINSSSVATIVDAYLKRGDHNVICVDWNELADGNYIQVVSNVGDVGKHIALGITKMFVDGLSKKLVHVVGHSMGAHVAGFIGRKIGFLLPRITGLDPAGPFFNFFNERLTKNDAKFVDIIHTDSGFYGMVRDSGTADFWPNRGSRIQPGCPRTFVIYSPEDFCSHHRSWIFYAESLINENAFLSVKCSSGLQQINKKVEFVPMGYATASNKSGSYCLITTANEPYGMGIKGARVLRKFDIHETQLLRA